MIATLANTEQGTVPNVPCMTVRITDARWIPTFALGYDDWLAVLDALETDATHQQRERAQDVLQRTAPYPWLEAVERRDTRR